VTLRFGDWIIILLFGCLVFFHFRGIDLAAGKELPKDEAFEKKLLLFIIDFRDFSCMTCLDSFLGFCRQLPFHFKTSGAWGIMVVKESEEKSAQSWIAEKKLRGFMRANRITFPIFVDKGHIFKGLAEKGSCVLLLDGKGSRVHKYDFPLTGDKFEAIFRILNN
jgi:hypothetical protein